MARYTDAEQIEKRLMELFMEPRYMHDEDNYYTGMSISIDEIRHAPTADVVPKSEVEMTIKEVDRLSQVVLYNDSITEMKVEEAKAEFARRFFEEIEKEPSLIIAEQKHYIICENDLVELKKKYTGTCTQEKTKDKYFTPQDVRKMTPKEVHDNYTAIKKSMESWS